MKDRVCCNVPEMAKLLGISRSEAYRLANQQDFRPAFRIGGRILINIAELQKWADEMCGVEI